MYAKLFTSIYQGTLRGNSHGLLVFTNLLAHCDKAGIVDMHPRAIAEEVGLSVDQVRLALDELERPDEESRSPENEGRRIVRLDEHRSWGWTVVNYTKYRAIRDEEDRREQNRLSQERWRNRHKTPSSAVSQGKPQSAHTEAEAYTEKTIVANATHPSKPGDARFNAFWKAYPRKVGKDAARKAFDKRKPDDVLTEWFIRAIESQARSEPWRKDGGQFIPNPATWLNQGRWMDEGIVSPASAPVETWKPDAMTPEQVEAANKARRAAMGAIKRVSA